MKTPSMFVAHDASRTGKGQHLGYWTTSQVNDPYHLPWPGDFVDPNWDPAERAAVASYLDAQPDVQHWQGFSFCRLGCGMVPGCTDKSDGVYVWPAGFSHYLRAHNVKPPQEFIDHALGRAKQTKVAHPKFSLPGIYPLPDWVVEGGRAKVISEHGTLSVGTVVTVHSFADENVNIELAAVASFTISGSTSRAFSVPSARELVYLSLHGLLDLGQLPQHAGARPHAEVPPAELPPLARGRW